MNAASQRHTDLASRGDSPDSNSEGQGRDRETVWPAVALTAGLTQTPWTDVSDLVLCARCDMAMARVEGPLDVQRSYDHARAALQWARHAGASAPPNSPLPLTSRALRR